MPNINPTILKWARQTAGLSLEQASQKLRISNLSNLSAIERLIALENGSLEPTRPMLVKMAKQYRRPLLVFYMTSPPRKGNRGQDFRTLPTQPTKIADALVDTLLRQIQARQSIIRVALEDEDEDDILWFVGSVSIFDGVGQVLKSIQNALDFDLSDFRQQTSSSKAFALLRSKVESIGVFVLLVGDLGSHHTAIKPEVFRGFAIADRVAPFIIINDQDSRTAWSFTLIHELAHIWLGHTGVSNTFSEIEIEKFCNEVASRFFLQKTEFVGLNVTKRLGFEQLKTNISNFAQERNLSNSMVAYNLFLIGRIEYDTWARLNKIYSNLWHEGREDRRDKARKKGSGGPDYYVVRRHRLGKNLIDLVQRMMAGGTLTTSKAGKILGIKAKNVQKLMESNVAVKPGQIA